MITSQEDEILYKIKDKWYTILNTLKKIQNLHQILEGK